MEKFQLIQKRTSFERADAQMPTNKNIERQMVSVGNPISQKIETSGFTWPRWPGIEIQVKPSNDYHDVGITNG